MPSRRNSGLETTRKVKPLLREYAFSARRNSKPVRAGTVLFSMTSFGERASVAIWRATLSMAERSASPFSFGGVPTQMKIASLARIASPASAVKEIFPDFRAESRTLSKCCS